MAGAAPGAARRPCVGGRDALLPPLKLLSSPISEHPASSALAPVLEYWLLLLLLLLAAAPLLSAESREPPPAPLSRERANRRFRTLVVAHRI